MKNRHSDSVKANNAALVEDGSRMPQSARRRRGSVAVPPDTTESISTVRMRKPPGALNQRWSGMMPEPRKQEHLLSVPTEANVSPLPLRRAPLESGEHDIIHEGLSRTEHDRRVQALVGQYLDLVWRSLRRLGVPEADCDDGCQRVWLVVSRKLEIIEPGKERSYIFSVAVRVASEMRRRGHRLQETSLDEEGRGEQASMDLASDPEQSYQRRQARQRLDEILSGMSWELRTAFVMFELEGFTSPEIAKTLDVSRGTIASRLRLAREHFTKAIERCEEANFSPAGRAPEGV